MPARAIREPGHQKFIRRPSITPLVGEHKVKKAERLAREQAAQMRKAHEDAAASEQADKSARTETSKAGK
jgi:hypothetical protein